MLPWLPVKYAIFIAQRDEFDHKKETCGNMIRRLDLMSFLTHWGRDKMGAIFQVTFSNGSSRMNIDVWILIKMSLENVPRRSINNIPVLSQIIAWRRPGDKLFSEAMMVC